MKRPIFALLIPVIILALSGCAIFPSSPQLTPLQRRVMESKELKGTYDDAFRATIFILQDMGFIIKNSDFNGGIIYAESSRGSFAFGKDNYQYKASVNLEKFTEERVKIRISLHRDILETANSIWPRPFAGRVKLGPVQDAKLYQDLYNEIQKEIFRREQFNK